MKYIKFVIITTIALLISITFTIAQDADTTQTIAIDVTDEGITVPAEVTGGLTEIDYTNQVEAPAVLSLARLNPDVTRDELLTTLQESGPEAATRLVTLLGAPLLLPETTVQTTYMLEEGTHLVLNLAAETPQLAFIDVTSASSDMEATEPETDVTVTLMDFAFTMPLEVEAAEQTWLIENTGQQWHEMAIARVEDDTDIADLQTRITEAAFEASESVNPLQPSIFLTPIDADQSVWMTIDLEPGTYIVHCFLPDIVETGHPHAMRGMVQIITVTE